MKKSPDGLTVARANRPPQSELPEAVDELPNDPNLHNLSTTPFLG